jgi:hypothetical protein
MNKDISAIVQEITYVNFCGNIVNGCAIFDNTSAEPCGICGKMDGPQLSISTTDIDDEDNHERWVHVCKHCIDSKFEEARKEDEKESPKE